MKKIKNRIMLKHNSQKLSVFYNIINPMTNSYNNNPVNLFNLFHKLKSFIGRLLSFFKLNENKLNLYKLSYNDEKDFSSLYDDNIKNINIFNNYRKNSTFFKCLIYFLSSSKNKIKEEIIEHKLTVKNELIKKSHVKNLNNEYSNIKNKKNNYLNKNIFRRIFNNFIKIQKGFLKKDIKDFSEYKYLKNFHIYNEDVYVELNENPYKNSYESISIKGNFLKKDSSTKVFAEYFIHNMKYFAENLIYNFLKNNLDIYNFKRIKNKSNKKHYNNLSSNNKMFFNKEHYNENNRNVLKNTKHEIVYNLIKAVKKMNKSSKKFIQRINFKKYNSVLYNSEKLNTIKSSNKNYYNSTNHDKNIKTNNFNNILDSKLNEDTYLFNENTNESTYCFKKKINISKEENLKHYSESNAQINKINFIKSIKLLRRINFYKQRISKYNNEQIVYINNQLKKYKNFKNQLFNTKLNNINSSFISSTKVNNSKILANEILNKFRDENVHFINEDEGLLQYHTDNITNIDSVKKFISFINNKNSSNTILNNFSDKNNYFTNLYKLYSKKNNNTTNSNFNSELISIFKLNNNKVSFNKVFNKFLDINNYFSNLNKWYSIKNDNTVNFNSGGKFISLFKLNNNKVSTNKIFKLLLEKNNFIESLNKCYSKNYNNSTGINNYSKYDFNSVDLYKKDIQSISNIKKTNYEKNINNEVIRKKVNIKHYNNYSQPDNNKKNKEFLMTKKDEIMKVLKFHKSELLEIINDAMKINKRLEY